MRNSEKCFKTTEFRDLWCNLKRFNTWVLRVTEEKTYKMVQKKNIWTNNIKYFPNLLTGINVLIQETKWIPTKINMKKTTLGTLVSNGWKPRYKVDHVRKRRTSHTGKNSSNDYWIFIKNYEIQKQWGTIFKVLKKDKQNVNPEP